jgi:hypothetical protein
MSVYSKYFVYTIKHTHVGERVCFLLSLERHRWRIGYRARRACSRLLVRDPVGSNQRLYHSIGICCFSDKHAALMSKNKAGSNRREPPTMRKQLVDFITCGCESSAPFL